MKLISCVGSVDARTRGFPIFEKIKFLGRLGEISTTLPRMGRLDNTVPQIYHTVQFLNEYSEQHPDITINRV